MPQTLLDKVWNAHLVAAEAVDRPAVLYIDLHLIHEVTSPQAFAVLAEQGLAVARPDRTYATLDHSTPTVVDEHGQMVFASDAQRLQVEALEQATARHGIRLAGRSSPERGIVHVIGPELGLTQPGMTIVCGDSHTATHGAFGALAFGIGTTEVGHVLATQCLLQRKPKAFAVEFDGALQPGVSAKDLILHLIGRIGVDGGTGHVFEFRGSAVRALDMESRMTLCNMAIEAGARGGMIAPDQTTFDYLHGRPAAPHGEAYACAVADWQQYYSDADAVFDRELRIDASTIEPTISWGTHPGQVIAIDAMLPRMVDDPRTAGALAYMGLKAGQRLIGEKVDVVFIGSCTNGRLSDLRVAAAVLAGRKLPAHVRMLVVPGSGAVKRAAEAEGLDRVFVAAGAQWREPGCSMCIAMNGDQVGPGELAVSTSNRNFEGRQGSGSRTLLASPLTAAACALAGVVVDPREVLAA